MFLTQHAYTGIHLNSDIKKMPEWCQQTIVYHTDYCVNSLKNFQNNNDSLISDKLIETLLF